jgi:hypothetical protein
MRNKVPVASVNVSPTRQFGTATTNTGRVDGVTVGEAQEEPEQASTLPRQAAAVEMAVAD